MLRPVIQVSLLLFFLLLFPFTAPAKVVEQLIAVVNGEPYTLSNLADYAKNKLRRAFPSGDLNQINAEDREVLEQFITDKLLEAEVREAGIRVSAEDVDQYVEQVKKNNRLSDDDLKTALSREGQTVVSYRASVKAELERGEIINRQVRKKVNITDEDVERYYKLNAKDYRAGDRVRLRHILLAVSEKAAPEQIGRAMESGKDLYRRITEGEDFAVIAREFSEGGGRAEGGDIGWIKRGSLVNEIEEIAFQKLSVGQVSEPFRTSMGVHLVKLEAREAGNLMPLATVAPRIKEELSAKALEERFAKWLKTDLRRKHRVDVKIAGVVFKPEDSKEGTVDSLFAKSPRANRREERTMLSYLNPLSYIIKETPFEEDDPKSPLAGKSVVSIFGVPLFTTDSVEDTPDVFAAPVAPAAPDPAASASGAGQSKGVFSTIVDSLNPFKK